jgi:nucleotide-binding universal stress UspA family protein
MLCRTYWTTSARYPGVLLRVNMRLVTYQSKNLLSFTNVSSCMVLIMQKYIWSIQKGTAMYKKILIATDGSEHSERAEIHGLTLAKDSHASVTALYVVEVVHPVKSIGGPPSLLLEGQIEGLVEEGKKIVDRVVQKGKDMGVEVTPLVGKGHPAQEIIEHARDHDLVVVGTLGRTGLSHLLLGSVAEKVVRHAPCPVLVVRDRENEQD